MNKVFCDRCGKEIITDKDEFAQHGICDFTTREIKHYDLCRNCEMDFQKLFTEFLQKPVDSTEEK